MGSDIKTIDRKTEKSPEQKKLVTRNVVISVLVCVFLVSIISVYHYSLYKEKRESIIRKGETAAKDAADQFDKYLSANSNSLKLAAYAVDEMIKENRSDEEIQNYLVAQSTAIKTAILENSTGLYGYINGRFFSGTNWVPPEGYDAKARPWYSNPFNTPGEIAILDPYIDVQSGNTMLALGKVLVDGESVLSVDVSLDRIQSLTENAVIGEDSEIEMILNDKAMVVAHSDINEIGHDYNQETGTFGAEIAKHLAEGIETHEFTFNGRHYLAYVADIQNGWHCISVTDATEVFKSLTVILVLTVLVEIVIVVIISIMMTRSTRLSMMSVKAQAENEAKSAFLSKVSHELRTPINAIMGMNEMILRESGDKAITSYSKKIKASGDVLIGIVDDMIVHSKFEEGRANAVAEHLDLSELSAEDAVEELVQNPERYKAGFSASDAYILAVDDNPMNLMVFQGLIKQTGVKVDSVGSGEEALSKTLEKKYDLIFLDHMMPGKDGIETLHEIRGNKANPNLDTPAICLTANAIAGAREKYLEEGFNDYLAKPIDSELLEEMMLKLLPAAKVHRKAASEAAEEENADRIPPELIELDGEMLHVEIGIKNSGTPAMYMSLLKVFYESVEENSAAINNSFAQKDYKNYVIKVHALKSSARIIGATEFGEEAQDLENAGKAENIEYISAHHDAFMDKYMKYHELLDGLFVEADYSDKPEADEGLMASVYEELAAAAGDMDCDRLEAVFGEMEAYRVPKADKDLFVKLKAATERYEYDTITELLKDR